MQDQATIKLEQDVIEALTKATTVGEPQLPLTLLMEPPPITGASESVTLAARDLGHGVIENRYYIMMMLQTFDGVFDRAHSQKAGFARLRNADESWVRIDYGDGAMVIREPESLGEPPTLAASRFVNTTPTEVAIAYDYKTNSMRGNPVTSAYHNTFIRPLMGGMPPLGSDVTWTVQLSAAKLGVTKAQSRNFVMEVKRTYFSHAGTPYVILEYTVPDFVYGNAFGEKVTHRARGIALTDPAMGQIYWNTSLQTASTDEVSGTPRPYRYARTGFAMDANGQPLLDLAEFVELKPFLDDFYGATATAPLPVVGGAVADQTPLEMAAKIDMAGFALGENSGNQLVEAIGSYSSGETGSQVGASLDYAINNVIIPALAVFNGADATEARYIAENGSRLQAAIKLTSGEITRVTAAYRVAQGELRNANAELIALRSEISTLSEGWASQINAARTPEEFFAADATLLKLGKLQGDSEAAFSHLRQASITMGRLKIELGPFAKLRSALANSALANVDLVTTMREGPVMNALASVGELINAQKTLPFAITALGYTANVAGVAKNLSLLETFDPHQAGNMTLNGTYTGWMGLVEPALNIAAIGGDFESGNMKAVALDIANFVGGRFGDVYMSFQAAKAARIDAQIAFMREVQTGLRSAAQNKSNIEKLLTATNGLGLRIEALHREREDIAAQARGPGGVNDPNWTDPRFDPRTHLPIPAYWAYLKANSPETLRRMGIDPDAPVGGWPNGRGTDNRPDTRTAQQAAQPRQPGGPGYPTRDPSTVSSRPMTPSTQAANLPAPTLGGTRPMPSPYIPPPRRPGRNDHLGDDESPITQHATSMLRVTPLTIDPVTFRPPTFTPVTWTSPQWTPVTWTPPTWTPPRYDAPKASEIKWTDLGSGKNWPKGTNNMAFGYGDMSGRVATDLSQYQKWLKTQNQMYLEQLAKTAGYPNLASALKDSTSLLRKANDPGFFTWAWSPPAVSGAINSGFSEGQHEMGRAAYMLGDLLNRSGFFRQQSSVKYASKSRSQVPDNELCGQ